jgi:hypothetical protein
MTRALAYVVLVVVTATVCVGVWRLARANRRRSLRRRREDTFPYEMWYALRQQKADAGDRVLEGLWAQLLAERQGVARPALRALVEGQVAEMAGAIEVLRRAHIGDPALPPALAVLEERVRRLCNDLAALQPGGGAA